MEAKQVVLAIPPGQVATGPEGAADVAWRVPETAPTGKRVKWIYGWVEWIYVGLSMMGLVQCMHSSGDRGRVL